MVGVPSLFTDPTALQPPLHSLVTIPSSTLAIFQLPVPPPYLFKKPSQPTNTIFLYTSACQPIQSKSWTDTVLIYLCFTGAWPGLTVLTINNSLLVSIKNWFITVAFDEDACDESGKQSTLSTPLPVTYYY